MSKNHNLEIDISGGPKEPTPDWFRIAKAVQGEAFEIFQRAGLTGRCPLRALNPIINGVMPGQGMQIKQVLKGDLYRGEQIWGITFEAQPFDRDSCWIWLHRLPNGTDPNPTAEKLRAAIANPTSEIKPVQRAQTLLPENHRQALIDSMSEYLKDHELLSVHFEKFYGPDQCLVISEDVARTLIMESEPTYDTNVVDVLLGVMVKGEYLIYNAADKAYGLSKKACDLLKKNKIDVPEGGYEGIEVEKPEPKKPAQKPEPKPQAAKVLPERVRAEPPKTLPVQLKPQPMAHFRIQLNAVRPAPERPEIYKDSRGFYSGDISDEERLRAIERADIIAGNPDYTARVLRYILSHSEWSVKHPPVIEKGNVLDAIVCAYQDILTRNDAGLIWKRFLDKGYFQEIQKDVKAYVTRPIALNALKVSRIDKPYVNDVHYRKAPEPQKPAPPPVNTAMAEALKPIWKPTPQPAAAPAIPAPKALVIDKKDFAAYMRVISPQADGNGHVMRGDCVEELKQFVAGDEVKADALFDSLVEAGNLVSLEGSTSVFQIDKRGLNQPARLISEAPAARAAPVEPSPAAKPEPRAAVPNQDLADMFARIQRGKEARERLGAIDAEMHKLQEEMSKQAARLAELMRDRAEAQSYLSSPEHREAVEYMSREINQLKGFDSH